MNNTSVTFNTVEDMAKWVVANPGYRSTMRFSLEDRISWEYDDVEAGKKWSEEDSAIPYVSFCDEPAHTHYLLIKEAHDQLQPKKHKVVTWYLDKAIERYSRNSTSIYLSPELAKEIDSVWKRGPIYRGSKETKRVGLVTIPGIVKRLGVKGFDKQIAEATKTVKEIADRNIRNNNRSYAIKQAEELRNSMTRNTNGVFSAETIQLISLAISNMKNSMEC
jgi:hypothetical protein